LSEKYFGDSLEKLFLGIFNGQDRSINPMRKFNRIINVRLTPLSRYFKKILTFLPPISVPASIRFGRTFWKTYYFLQTSQWWSEEKLKKYQLMQLRKLLYYAYENVPYYRKVFKQRNLTPSDIKSLDDLRKLPALDKDTFKKHFNEIIARNISLKRTILSHTSGTTGKPLQFYQSYSELEKEWAFIIHQWSRVGYRPGEPRVELRGSVISGRYPIEYDPVGNVLRLSPRIDNKDVAQFYLRKMKAFGAKYLHGYPSTIASFASIIRRYGLSVPFKLKAVFFASEKVYDWQRGIVEEVFKARAFSHYGQAEHVALAAECEFSSHYHFVPQYGVVEIDPQTHEIIATGFLNYVNPFIRYRTTDVASPPISLHCPYCGRHYFPIVKDVEGRLGDFIVTPQGGLVSPATMTHPFKDLKTIRETQLIQESIDKLVLRVVPWSKEEKTLKTELQFLHTVLQEILGHDMQIEIEIVEDIKKTKSGKFKWIISKVSKGLIEKGLDNV